MKTEILEAIQKGIQKSFNFEVDSDEEDFKIKKAKMKSKTNDFWAYLQYQEKYEELIGKKDFQRCLDFYNSGELNQRPRSIGYDISSKEDLRDIVNRFNNQLWDGFDLNWIDVSKITDMSFVFSDLEQFNCNISEWDVSNVTNMYGMFWRCEIFNSNLSSWNVSNVTDMYRMFFGCENFNSDLSQWDVSNVTDMNSMFYGCKNFNSDLSSWDVSNVKDYDNIFAYCQIKNKNKPKFK